MLALKVALESPAPTVTLAGTLTLVLLLCSVILDGLEVAAVRATVQVELPGELTVPGVQIRLLN
ncbi:MAG: hypothetical protein M3O20_00260 [Acidobacteriota bacterium]|nr:hypothetical protein [Acidobacteriota bacterium]